MNKKIITTTIVLFTILVLIILPSSSNNINGNLESLFREISPSMNPDSNIVIIHITSEDIESLGDWPLKRSYYALLISDLSELGVKKIGFEIFLSENLSSQSIYNNVLKQSIKKAGNVVLSCVAEDVQFKNNKYESSKINFPVVGEENKSTKIAHINFIEENGIIIPSQIHLVGRSINSFSQELYGINSNNINNKVNFFTDWENFKNYSLLEFFDKYQNNPQSLTDLKDKYIIVGVSDPLIGKSISVENNNELPGVALHAFALDNFFQDRFLKTSWFNISSYLFALITLIIIWVNTKRKILLSIFLFLLIVSFSLFALSYIQLNYSVFVFPFIVLFIVNFIYDYASRKKELDETQGEQIKLKNQLNQKEQLLSSLRKQLDTMSKPDDILLKRVNELEEEVRKIKAVDKDDKEVYESTRDAKNFEGIVYKSKQIDRVTELIKKVAPEDASVLIMGESGTGKELVANAIHNLSKRADKPFVAVNCAALPDTLLESELFGHVKGAFTDAHKDKVGRFEEANNGTLFLDEIGETSENFQVKLLRVLQTGDFQKVGSSQTIHSDVRIVAATNKNLQQLVKEKKFREDLYYRLNVISIELPNLNERTEDIEVLAEYFVKREDESLEISKAVVNRLKENTWSGNVRELESTIKRAVIFAKSENRKLIKLKDLPENLAKINKDELEDMIIESLRAKQFSHSSINETAKELGGLSRTVVTENLRGFFFKVFVENNYELDKSIKIVAASEDPNVLEKVGSKVSKYLMNIEKDLAKVKNEPFDIIKSKFASKYKNLPQKFHDYLDNVIKHLMIK